MKTEKSKEFNQALQILDQVGQKEKNQLDELAPENQEQEKQQINYKDVVEKEFDQLHEMVENLENQSLENVARIQTMARRHAEEDLQWRKYGGAKIAEDLLKPLDLLKKVVATPVENPEVKNYLVGFEMIIKQIDQVLNEHGIQVIKVQVGDDFDPKFHNANEQVEATGVKSGQIAEVMANGYMMYDRVILHTLVKVAK